MDAVRVDAEPAPRSAPGPGPGNPCLCPWILGYLITLDVEVDVMTFPVILGISKHLGVGLPLCVVRMGAEHSEYRFKQEGTHTISWVGRS